MEDYEVKKSRTGHPIVIVNGQHLHSEYDPIKEAKELIQDYYDVIKSNRNILVLGLGFGYHINEIIQELKKSHTQYKIYVIEPKIQVYDDYCKLAPLQDPYLEILTGANIENFYSRKDFVYFLTEGPAVIAHPPSLGLNSLFFHSFMDFNQKEDMETISKMIENEDLRSYVLSSEIDELNFGDFLKKINNRPIKNNHDLFFSILDRIN